MRIPIVGAAILGATLAGSAAAAPVPSTTATTTYHRAEVDGVGIFYREAGPKDAPTIVLLQGFPSSSRGYATLIPVLATHYHVVAPDFPGFGQSDAPSPATYSYTFDHLAEDGRRTTRAAEGIPLHALSVRLRGTGRLPHHPGPSRAAARADRPERQCLPGGTWAEMGADCGVLGRSEGTSGGRRRLHVL